MFQNSLKFGLFLAFSVFTGVASAEPPEAIDNLSATAGDGYIDLSWDEAVSPSGGIILSHRIYYGTTAVPADGDGEYDTDIDTSSSSTEHRVNDLSNGVTYYFAVTAIDDSGEESLYYSNEASGTPSAKSATAEEPEEVSAEEVEADDSFGSAEGLTVDSAEQMTNDSVKIILSSDLDTSTEAEDFSVQNQRTSDYVVVNGGVIQNNTIVLQVNEEFVEDDIYEVTASSAVKDLNGNPVSSGFTDTVTFTGAVFFENPELPSEETDIFTEEDPILIEEDPIVIEEDPIRAEAEQNTDILEDPFAGLGNDFLTNEFETSDSVENTTSDFSESEPSLFDDFNSSALPEITTDNTNSTDDFNLLNEYDSSAASTPSSLPEVTDLKVDSAQMNSEGQISIYWNPPAGIQSQVFYYREGLAAWSQGETLAASTTEKRIKVKPNTNYQVRITVKSSIGTESYGQSTSFSTNLSQSGPAAWVAIGLALLFGYLLLGRRRF